MRAWGATLTVFRVPFRGLIATLCLIGAVPDVLAQRDAYVLRCESRDYRDNYCPANTRGGVRLLRQVSRAPCWEGESWGYDRRGIWVSEGCAADFEIGGRGYGRPQHDDRRRRSEHSGGRRIVCESRDYRYNYCPIAVDRDVDLVYQSSKSECRFERSWGFDRGGVWVDRGCSAEFVVY